MKFFHSYAHVVNTFTTPQLNHMPLSDVTYSTAKLINDVASPLFKVTKMKKLKPIFSLLLHLNMAHAPYQFIDKLAKDVKKKLYI